MARLVIFRADASAEIGTGHVHRCLSLARALAARGWTAAFAVSATTPQAVPVLAQSTFKSVIVDGTPEQEIASMRREWPEGANLVVIDHYQRDVTFERDLRKWAKRLAAIDDLPSRPHDVDLLIDPTADRSASDYRYLLPSEASVSVGAQYIILRPEIVNQRYSQRGTAEKATRLFVSFGGSDPDNLTSRVIESLRDPRLAGVKGTVVIGAANPRAAAIVAGTTGNIRVLVNPENLPSLMSEADFALAGSGTMAWELAYFGVPSLLVIHSRGTVVDSLVWAGAARSLGEAEAVSSAAIVSALIVLAEDRAARAAMASAGRALIDGRGAERVADALEEIAR